MFAIQVPVECAKPERVLCKGGEDPYRSGNHAQYPEVFCQRVTCKWNKRKYVLSDF